MGEKIHPLEKKIIGAALLLSAAHLALIAYAAFKLGIGVPTCVTNVKPFSAGSFSKVADGRYEIHVLARMWSFEPNKIVLPVGSIADIYLGSKDVTHGFHVGGTNVNLMAVPGVLNYAQVKFPRPGTYRILCHEYCGTGHQAMNGVIEVSDSVTEGHAEGLSTPAPAVLTSAPNTGRKIMEAKGCIACHSFDGTQGVGPTFKGVWGRKEEFTDGTSLVVDAPYLRESILDPQKKIVKGFGPVMPKLPITDQEVDQIIEYLKTLR